MLIVTSIQASILVIFSLATFCTMTTIADDSAPVDIWTTADEASSTCTSPPQNNYTLFEGVCLDLNPAGYSTWFTGLPSCVPFSHVLFLNYSCNAGPGAWANSTKTRDVDAITEFCSSFYGEYPSVFFNSMGFLCSGGGASILPLESGSSVSSTSSIALESLPSSLISDSSSLLSQTSTRLSFSVAMTSSSSNSLGNDPTTTVSTPVTSTTSTGLSLSDRINLGVGLGIGLPTLILSALGIWVTIRCLRH